MSAKIACYIDCVSPFSYFALLHLEKYRDVLKSHNVEIDIVPVFLGGINHGSGNKPPWTLPAKGAYMNYDSARAKRYFGISNMQTPSFFPIISLLPQRALCYVKGAYPDQFIDVFVNVFRAMWEGGRDVSKSEELVAVLQAHFKEDAVNNIMENATSTELKQRLNDNTEEALDRGAFGCPWFFVKNAKGVEEPFFGSDRFHFMWEYLGLPWSDVELLSSSEPTKSKI